jgi:hypothetical protein
MMIPMVHYEDYVAGWLANSIHDFLSNLPSCSASMKYALISGKFLLDRMLERCFITS